MAINRLRGRAGVKRRAGFLAANPLCAHCWKEGRFKAASEVDHIKPLRKQGADSIGNLQSLCSACHATKTMADMDRVRRLGCDASGWPVDDAHPWNEREVSPDGTMTLYIVDK